MTDRLLGSQTRGLPLGLLRRSLLCGLLSGLLGSLTGGLLSGQACGSLRGFLRGLVNGEIRGFLRRDVFLAGFFLSTRRFGGAAHFDGALEVLLILIFGRLLARCLVLGTSIFLFDGLLCTQTRFLTRLRARR